MARARLNKAMAEVLRKEARRDLENNIQERALGRRAARGELAAAYERWLLACADVLGELSWATLGWGVSGCEIENADTVEVSFSRPAEEWMEKIRGECEEHLAEISERNEGDHDYCAGEAYLVYTLNHVLSGDGEALPARG